MINKLQATYQTGNVAVSYGAYTAASVIYGIDPFVIIGALIGASVFILSRKSYIWPVKIVLFLLSFAGGILSTPTLSSIFGYLTPAAVNVDSAMGAMIGAVSVVLILQGLIWTLDNPLEAARRAKAIYELIGSKLHALLLKFIKEDK